MKVNTVRMVHVEPSIRHLAPVVRAALPDHGLYRVNHVTGQIWYTGAPQQGGILNTIRSLTPQEFTALKAAHAILYVGYDGTQLGTTQPIMEYWLAMPSDQQLHDTLTDLDARIQAQPHDLVLRHQQRFWLDVRAYKDERDVFE
jgi:hypothetical protein